MLLLTTCSIVLLLSLGSSARASYIVDLAPRGIIFGNLTKTQLLEPRLCFDNDCLFVEKTELDLLNIDLGDNNNEIFTALQEMSETNKDFLFWRLQFIHLIKD